MMQSHHINIHTFTKIQSLLLEDFVWFREIDLACKIIYFPRSTKHDRCTFVPIVFSWFEDCSSSFFCHPTIVHVFRVYDKDKLIIKPNRQHFIICKWRVCFSADNAKVYIVSGFIDRHINYDVYIPIPFDGIDLCTRKSLKLRQFNACVNDCNKIRMILFGW